MHFIDLFYLLVVFLAILALKMPEKQFATRITGMDEDNCPESLVLIYRAGYFN